MAIISVYLKPSVDYNQHDARIAPRKSCKYLNQEKTFSVTINEHTPDKYQKLKKVVHASLPSNIPTRLTGWDTLKFGVNETAQYDRVLLDCPCSDERRVFNDEKLVKKWTDKAS